MRTTPSNSILLIIIYYSKLIKKRNDFISDHRFFKAPPISTFSNDRNPLRNSQQLSEILIALDDDLNIENLPVSFNHC